MPAVSAAIVAGFVLLSMAAPEHRAGDRIDLRMDVSEARAVLAILAEKSSAGSAGEEAWKRLFESEPYVRLKKREAALHRDFTDEDFRKFVLSSGLAERSAELRTTLERWVQADLESAARRVLDYLPANASIRAKVYPVIKPVTNSFVFEVTTDLAIFLYLDPKVSAEKFENTVAHELHHIGYASVHADEEKAEAGSPAGVRTAVEWMGAFGEGFAMLAAAGSPEVHPHAASDRAERERWDRDMSNVRRDFEALERFFLDVIDGRLKTKEAIQQEAQSFFGIQGPWYTVGYKMAVVIEKEESRAALIDCMSSPRKLLATYNRDAARVNPSAKEKLPLWSDKLLVRIGAVQTK